MNTHQRITASQSNNYSRLRDLPALVAMWPKEMEDFTIKGRQHIITMIEKALRSERRRGKANHWSYNLTRHISLLKAFKAEKSHLKAVQATSA